MSDTNKFIGLLKSRCFIKYNFSIEDFSRPFTPIPYTVSVGNTAIPPFLLL